MPVPFIKDIVKGVKSVTIQDFNPIYIFSKKEKDGDHKSLDDRFKLRIQKMKEFNNKNLDRLHNVFAAPLHIIADFIPPVHPKTEDEIAFISKVLGDSFVFASLARKERRILVDAFERTEVPKGRVIINQGDIGDYFYILQKGNIKFVVDGAEVGEAESGESFGELALMYDSPRAATAIAMGSCHLFRVGQRTFRRILMSFDVKKHGGVKDMLKKVEYFQDLDDRSLTKVAAAMQVVNLPKGEMLEISKDAISRFYVVQEGKIEVTELELNGQKYPDTSFTPGDHFGAAVIMKGEHPFSAIFTAVQETTLLEMSKEHFVRMVGNPQDILQKNMDKKKLKTIQMAKEKKLSGPEAEILSHHVINKVYPKGHQFFIEGTPTKARLMLVRSGKIQITTSQIVLNLQYLAGMEMEGGGPRTIGEHGYFGDDTINLDNSKEQLVRPMYSATALEDCEVGVVSLHTILAVVRKARGKDIALSELTRHILLGTGSFGKVYLVTKKDNREAWALKSQNKKQLIECNQADGVVREREAMGMLDYPFIIKLVTTFQDKLHVYMLTSLYLGGELRSVLQNSRNTYIPEWAAKFYAANVLDGLGYMHRRRILYRDLKPENVLLDSQGYTVIVDLGFAKYVPDKTYTFCGTPLYLAPEIILQRGHDEGVDHWSWAVMLYEMIVGVVPFWDEGMDQRALLKAIVRGHFEFPEGDFMSDASKDLLKRMLVVQPEKRLGSFATGDMDIRSHSFFDEIDWEALANKELETPMTPQIKDPLDSTNFKNFKDKKEFDDGVPLTRAEEAIFKDF